MKGKATTKGPTGLRDPTDELGAKLKALKHDLKERTKELQCLYGITGVAERPGITLDELYQEVVNLLPSSWQYPEITCARITINGKEFKTGHCRDRCLKWKQSSEIRVFGTKVGEVQINYLEKKPEIGEGPFLKEERRLIDAVAALLGDITERKRVEEKLQLSYRIIEIAERHKELVPMLKEFVSAIKSFTGCAAVGIRILDAQGNIPYQAYDGFSRKFYESESPLSIKSDKCMCIYVIRGDIDPSLPFCTERGSFYMNGTTPFLATVSEEEKGETRNVCNEYGYESVALVPIELKDRTLGLIHVADPRENMVPLKTVEILETVAVQLGIAIRRVRAEERQELTSPVPLRGPLMPLQRRFVRLGFEALEEEDEVRLAFSLCRYRPECDEGIEKCSKNFKGLRELLSASEEKLQRIGICPRGVFTVRLLRELPEEVLKQKILEKSVYKSPQEIFDYLSYSMRDLEKEVFKVIYLNKRNAIIDAVDLFEGTLDSIPIRPREIMESAIAHNAAGLIFAHNHPTGDPAPSRTDKRLTRELVFVGMIMQIKVLDHIIIGENRYFGFADEKLIEKYEDDFLNLRIRAAFYTGVHPTPSLN